jgi:hypothetical protein
MKNCTNRKLDNAREKENEELFSLSLIKWEFYGSCVL